MKAEDLALGPDELLGVDPVARRRALEAALAALRDSLLGQRVLVGAPMPAVSSALDPEQQETVASDARTIRLLAPAGSGKTHCIANRVVERQRRGVPSGRLLLVTFNRAAANELRQRIAALTAGRPQPDVHTLNALGNALLRRHRWDRRAPRLINEARGAQFAYVKKALDALKAEKPAAYATLPDNLARSFFLDLFSLFKNQLVSPRSTADELSYASIARVLTPLAATSAAPLFAKAGTEPKRLGALMFALDRLFRGYERLKDEGGWIDYDDQKLLAYEMLRDEHAIRELAQEAWDEIIVDEFQDLNELDFRLILLLAERAGLVVVGDDDQAIYGFRGTSPRYIIDFEALSGRSVVSHQLRRNYRCPRNIVAHATGLIRHNTYRIEKEPIAERKSLCDIRVYDALTPTAEAALIGEFVARLRTATPGPGTLRNVAILYRMNSQSLPLQLEFVKRGIPFYCRREDNILGKEFLPRLVAVLRYVDAVQGKQDPSLDDFVEAVRSCFRFFSDSDVAHLRTAARGAGSPYLSALEDPALRRSVAKLRKDTAIDAIGALVTHRDPLAVVSVMAKRFPGLRGMIGSLEEAVDNALPLGEVGDLAAGFASLGEFVRFLEEMIARAGGVHTDQEDADAVRLMTYFRCKGLQFETVILPTVNAGIIPHRRAPLEDERRLFYVAVTRTTKNLWISHVRKVCGQRVQPSGFLPELELPASAMMAPVAR